MITPRFLSAAADQMMRLYAELETSIKADMCRRLAKLGAVTDATEWQAKILREIGGLNSDISRQLAKYDKATQKQVQELFESLVEKNVPAEISDNQKQMMAATAGYQSLITDLSNLTRTSTATTEFISVANAMYMKVASGAFSYNQAIKDAVDEMASKGLTTLQYGNQAHSIESIARTCVITTLGQTAASQSIQNAQDTDTDLVMVSAHEGARHTDKPANPWSNHDEWQGKIYCLNGERDWKDSEGNIHHALNFHDACGYGEVDGICGINCRHTFYPFYEGESPRYDDSELKEYREKNLDLDGKKVSRYEAEQAMRKCERQIRNFKRLADCQAAADLDNTLARFKIGQWQAARLSISKQTGIPADYAREYIGTEKKKQPSGTSAAALLKRTEKVAKKMFPEEGWNKVNDHIYVAFSRYSTVRKEIIKLDEEIEFAKIMARHGHSFYFVPEKGGGKHFDTICDGYTNELKTVTGSLKKVGARFNDGLAQGQDVSLRVTRDFSVTEVKSKLIGELKGKDRSGTVYVLFDKTKKLCKWSIQELCDYTK